MNEDEFIAELTRKRNRGRGTEIVWSRPESKTTRCAYCGEYGFHENDYDDKCGEFVSWGGSCKISPTGRCLPQRLSGELEEKLKVVQVAFSKTGFASGLDANNWLKHISAGAERVICFGPVWTEDAWSISGTLIGRAGVLAKTAIEEAGTKLKQVKPEDTQEALDV